jgi:response regulator NasT
LVPPVGEIMPLRIILVDDDQERSAFLTASLVESHYAVVAQLTAQDNLLAVVEQLEADVVLVDMDSPARDMLENCASMTAKAPHPIVLFTKQSDPETIASAVNAGVTAYIVDGIDTTRLKPILDVAIAQFKQHQKLLADLDDTRTRLADRRDIDRAKAILMRVRQLDENAAYALLRRNAMTKRITLGEAARTVLAAAELLDQGE